MLWCYCSFFFFPFLFIYLFWVSDFAFSIVFVFLKVGPFLFVVVGVNVQTGEEVAVKLVCLFFGFYLALSIVMSIVHLVLSASPSVCKQFLGSVRLCACG